MVAHVTGVEGCEREKFVAEAGKGIRREASFQELHILLTTKCEPHFAIILFIANTKVGKEGFSSVPLTSKEGRAKLSPNRFFFTN